MRKFIIYIAFAFSIVFSDNGANAAKRNSDLKSEECFIVTELSEEDCYIGSTDCYVVKLLSTNPNIEFARLIKQPDMAPFHIWPIEISNRISNEIKNVLYKGKSYYSVILDVVPLIAIESGNFKFGGGEYSVGINKTTEYADPFWGLIRRPYTEEFSINVPLNSVNVRKMPEKVPQDFSGACGNFQIESILPEGQIIPGIEASVIFRITGEGNLENINMPNLESSFGPELGLKNIRKFASHEFVDGKIVSKLEIECSFVPANEGDMKILPVKLVYFNTIKGKFQNIESMPVYFTAKLPELPVAPPVLYDI